ncbi:hypothetical protein HPB47_003384 [Ixodes persulcatus]|uniref:Uncharacterized protein n=1 Tax=Ixodes persulcatus TaxID=34615 RepID=A0AC60PJP0_IXOPE|nr:hypothetical protein HPB47_003384 [Ixodes persulcatus]
MSDSGSDEEEQDEDDALEPTLTGTKLGKIVRSLLRSLSLDPRGCFRESLGSIAKALETVSQWRESSSAAKARSLLTSILDAEFVIATLALYDVLSVTLPLSRLLQNPDLEMNSASDIVKDTIVVLSEKRNPLNQRFPEEVLEVYSLNTLLPRHVNEKGAPGKLSILAAKYGVLLGMEDVALQTIIRAEFSLWAAKWRREQEKGPLPSTAVETLQESEPELYPNITTLLRSARWLRRDVCNDARTRHTLVSQDLGAAVESGKRARLAPRRPGYDSHPDRNWYQVTVDSMTCLLKSVVRRENGKGIEVQQNFAAYTSSHGHYLFSPDSPVAVEFKDNITCRIVTTTLVHEVHQWINPWISQVIRLYVSEDYVEFDWTLGPVPLKSSQGTLSGGHDVVTRFQSNLDNAGVFFTDSNGKLTVRRVAPLQRMLMREEVHFKVKAKRRSCVSLRSANSTGVWKPVGPSPAGGYAENVEANYYPVVSWLYLRDNATGLQMTLLPDRPQGGTGYRTGQLELMVLAASSINVQRRLTASDNKGLEDPLDDRGLNKKGMVIRGRHLLHVAPIEEAAVRVRAMANALVLAPVLSFSDATAPYSSDVKTRRFKGLATHLPMNVQLLTLYQDAPGRVLMRLEHMQPAVPPDELAVVNASIPIQALLSTYTMKNFREVSLTASRWKNSKFEPLRWTPSNRSALPGTEPRLDRSDAKGALTAVQLFTGEIRTFVADL